MSKHHEKNTTGRTVAVVGGGALLLWLLLRGKGWGFGDGSGRAEGAATPRSKTPPRCRVRIDRDGIELDGVAAEIPAVVARCRETGAADVLATGAAISGVVDAVLDALRVAGVVIHHDTPASRSAPARTRAQ